MGEQLVWLKSAQNLTGDKLLEIQAAVAPLGVAVGMTYPSRIVAEHGKQYVIENGVSSLFTAQLLEEEILPQASTTTRQPLFDVIKKFLTQLAPSQSVTIVDPYFFAARNVLTYPSIVANVLGPAVNAVSQITFVRDGTKDVPGLSAAVVTALKSLNSSLTISDHTTSDFHDRFWIVDGTRGLVLGTSLNGVGNRVCLLDYLSETDVAAIVQELSARGIVL
jgi:hypothetical protein